MVSETATAGVKSVIVDRGFGPSNARFCPRPGIDDERVLDTTSFFDVNVTVIRTDKQRGDPHAAHVSCDHVGSLVARGDIPIVAAVHAVETMARDRHQVALGCEPVAPN
jgi:hypothetical protein